MMNDEITPELLAELEIDLKLGLTIRAIAIKKEVTMRTIHYWIRKAGIDASKLRPAINSKEPASRKKELTYEDYLKKQVAKHKMTPQERLKIVNKFRTNFNNYVFVGDVEFNPESLDQ